MGNNRTGKTKNRGLWTFYQIKKPKGRKKLREKEDITVYAIGRGEGLKFEHR